MTNQQKDHQVTEEEFTLSTDQADALEAIRMFIIDPNERVFVLQGYSGCGKSTLVDTLVRRMPGFLKLLGLVAPHSPQYELVLTATTNKAAENLRQITNEPVSTIHSFLGLKVATDLRTGKTALTVRRPGDIKRHKIVIVDEASFMDQDLLGHTFTQTDDCKIIFVLDPAQLAPVLSSFVPVAELKAPGAALTKVMRQAEGNPIIELGAKFRETVNTGEFFSFKPDGNAIVHLDDDAFMQAIHDEFVRPDWKYSDSKILAWTNKTGIAYNNWVRDRQRGDPKLRVGDYALCNNFIQIGKDAIRTDQIVEVTHITEGAEAQDIPGRYYTLDGKLRAFMPDSLESKAAARKAAVARKDYYGRQEIDEQWVDLRAVYACTVNKSQGSTYDKVFIDLTDIAKCTSGEQIARMMYVAVTRARTKVFLRGDLA